VTEPRCGICERLEGDVDRLICERDELKKEIAGLKAIPTRRDLTIAILRSGDWWDYDAERAADAVIKLFQTNRAKP
jgi:hypothetical protein